MHMQGPDPAITSRKRAVNGRNNRATLPSGGQRRTYSIRRVFLEGQYFDKVEHPKLVQTEIRNS